MKTEEALDKAIENLEGVKKKMEFNLSDKEKKAFQESLREKKRWCKTPWGIVYEDDLLKAEIKGRTDATQDFIKMIDEFGEFRCGWCDGELCPNIPREELKQKLMEKKC